MRYSAPLLALALLASAGCVSSAEKTPAQPAEQTQEVNLSAGEKTIIEQTNKQRAEAGLQPLQPSSKLMQAARAHSQNMARQQILSHVLDGVSVQDRVEAAGYDYIAVAENVAWNNPTPEGAVEGWMESPGHRANILGEPYTEIGVGIATSAEGEPYYTQVFARPKQAGMTASAAFTIVNDSDQLVHIALEGMEPSALQPGVTTRLKVGGVGELPEVKIISGKTTQKLDYKDGGRYVIENAPRQGAIEVKAAQPAAK